MKQVAENPVAVSFRHEGEGRIGAVPEISGTDHIRLRPAVAGFRPRQNLHLGGVQNFKREDE